MARFVEIDPESGVDEDAQWAMAPVGGGHTLAALLDAKDLELRFDRSRIEVKEVVENPRLDEALSLHPALSGAWWKARRMGRHARMLMLKGVRHGHTRVRARDPRGRTRATLAVSVKRRMDIDVGFNLVRSTRGADLSTAVKPTDVAGILDRTNARLRPQANIFLRLRSVHWRTFEPGHVVFVKEEHRATASAKHSWPSLVALGDSSAFANVFLVSSLQIGERGFTRRSHGLTVDTDIVIPPKRSLDECARTLAHETIHVLGVSASEHRLYDEEHIMGPVGTKIPQPLADRINP